MTRTLLLFAVALTLLPAAQASASTVSLTFEQLVALTKGEDVTLAVGANGPAKVAGKACGDVAENKLAVKSDECRAALLTTSPWDDDEEVKVTAGGTEFTVELEDALRAAETDPLGTATIEGAKLVTASVQANVDGEWVFFNGASWSHKNNLTAPAEVTRLVVAAVNEDSAEPPVLLKVPKGKEAPDKRAAVTPDQPDPEEESPDAPRRTLPSDWCSGAVGRGHETVCINAATSRRAGGDADGASNGFQILDGPRFHSILRPNTPLVLAIVHDADAKLEISVDGKRGLYEPGISDQVTADAQRLNPDEVPDETPRHPGYSVTHKRIAPQLPGTPVDIKVTLTPKGGEATEHVLEFEVEKTYLGAVRLGIGLAYSPMSQSFQATKAPGSSTYEITTRKITPIDAELVLGFSPFLNPGGRGYQSGRDRRFWQRLAPYIGLGVLATGGNASPIEALTSVHLGLEFEFNKSSSLALNFVLRRGHVLQEGYRVGGPIAASEVGTDSTVPTKFGLLPAMGIVFNVSPEFLRIARQSSTSFYRN